MKIGKQLGSTINKPLVALVKDEYLNESLNLFDSDKKIKARNGDSIVNYSSNPSLAFDNQSEFSRYLMTGTV